jgi:hypothetical protein
VGSPQTRESLITVFRSSFDPRAAKISADDWSKADAIGYFSLLVPSVSSREYKRFKKLYELVYKVDGSLPGPVDYAALFHERAQQKSNKELYAELREDDNSEEELREHDKQVLRDAKHRDPDPRAGAIALKLTLMAEMNPCFVADRKLWQWIEDAVGHVE